MSQYKSQRFVQSRAKKYSETNQMKKFPLVYVLTGIMIMLLSLIPITGSVVLVLWGTQILVSSTAMAIVLIVVGVLLFLTLVLGAIIFSIYYFSNDAEKKWREIRYKHELKFEDVFLKCEKCDATILIGGDVCERCGHIISKDESKEQELNKLKAYLLDNYNFEISDKNISLINSYFQCKLKTFEYVNEIHEQDSHYNANCYAKEGIFDKFIFNFKKIIVTCSIAIVCFIFAFLLFSKFIAGI